MPALDIISGSTATGAFYGLRPHTGVAVVRGSAIVLLSTAAAFCVRWALGSIDPEVPPYPPFLLAVLVNTIVMGRHAGVATAVASLGVAWIAFSPQLGSAFTPIAMGQYGVTAGAII